MSVWSEPTNYLTGYLPHLPDMPIEAALDGRPELADVAGVVLRLLVNALDVLLQVSSGKGMEARSLGL